MGRRATLAFFDERPKTLLVDTSNQISNPWWTIPKLSPGGTVVLGRPVAANTVCGIVLPSAEQLHRDVVPGCSSLLAIVTREVDISASLLFANLGDHTGVAGQVTIDNIPGAPFVASGLATFLPETLVGGGLAAHRCYMFAFGRTTHAPGRITIHTVGGAQLLPPLIHVQPQPLPPVTGTFVVQGAGDGHYLTRYMTWSPHASEAVAFVRPRLGGPPAVREMNGASSRQNQRMLRTLDICIPLVPANPSIILVLPPLLSSPLLVRDTRRDGDGESLAVVAWTSDDHWAALNNQTNLFDILPNEAADTNDSSLLPRRFGVHWAPAAPCHLGLTPTQSECCIEGVEVSAPVLSDASILSQTQASEAHAGEEIVATCATQPCTLIGVPAIAEVGGSAPEVSLTVFTPHDDDGDQGGQLEPAPLLAPPSGCREWPPPGALFQVQFALSSEPWSHCGHVFTFAVKTTLPFANLLYPSERQPTLTLSTLTGSADHSRSGDDAAVLMLIAHELFPPQYFVLMVLAGADRKTLGVLRALGSCDAELDRTCRYPWLDMGEHHVAFACHWVTLSLAPVQPSPE